MAKKKAKKKVAKKVVKKAAPKKAAPKAIAFKSMEALEDSFRKHCKAIVKDTMKKFGLGNIAIIGSKVGFPSEDQIVTLVAMDGAINQQDIMAWGHTVMSTYKSRVEKDEAEKKAKEAELNALTEKEVPMAMEQPIEQDETSAPIHVTESEEKLNDSSKEDEDEDFGDDDFDDDDDEDDDNDEGYF